VYLHAESFAGKIKTVIMQTLRPDILNMRPGCLPQAVADARAALGVNTPDVVLVNDPQRATSTPDVLTAMRGAFDFSSARLLVATGSHRFPDNQRQAFERKFAGTPFAAWDWHDARRADLAPVGVHDGWRAHPWVANARHILAIGSVEPHYFAGFTGAHKTLTIGCAAYADITRNHEHALSPACRPCRAIGTPVHDGIVRMLDQLDANHSLAVVNVMQSGGNIIDAAGGAPLNALSALIPKVEAAYLRRLPKPAPSLVVDVAGALACSFYQAEKGIKNSESAVCNGGLIVLKAACSEGIGQDAFVDLLRVASTYAEAVKTVQQRGYRLGDHKAVRLRYLTDHATRNVRVFVVSEGLSKTDAALLGVSQATSVEDAFQQAGVSLDSAYYVEDAGNTCVEA